LKLLKIQKNLIIFFHSVSFQDTVNLSITTFYVMPPLPFRRGSEFCAVSATYCSVFFSCCGQFFEKRLPYGTATHIKFEKRQASRKIKAFSFFLSGAYRTIIIFWTVFSLCFKSARRTARKRWISRFLENGKKIPFFEWKNGKRLKAFHGTVRTQK